MMGAYLSKFLAGFSYGAGFILAVVCAFYVFSQASTKEAHVVELGSGLDHSQDYLDNIEVTNVAMATNFTNYANVGPRKEFLFTGELTNLSSDKSYRNLSVEIDLFDSDGGFLFKCGASDGQRVDLQPSAAATFQKMCHSMPPEIADQYNSHKVLVKQPIF